MRHRPSFTPETLRRLTLKVEPWLSCDDCFAQVDAVIDDLIIRGVPMHDAFRAHLRGCPACSQEARALLELTAEGDGIDPAVPLAQFDAETSTSGQRR